MKKAILLMLLLSASRLYSQSANDILNLLIANKTITQEQADSLRADAAIKQQEADANKKSFFVTAARSLQISGYTHVRYQVLEEKGKHDGFDIRRVSLEAKGSFTPYFGYKVMADFAGSPRLMDAYAEIKLNDYLNFTIGQFKIPFSVENLYSMTKLELIDFSQPVEALVARSKDVIGNQNGRDIGLQLGGILVKTKSNPALLEYRLGVFNGSGMNVTDTANEAKDVVGRLILNPVKGLSVGGSYYNGWGKAIKPATKYTGRSQIRNRFGVEATYTRPRLLFRGEYIAGKDGDVKKAGWYILTGYYVIPQKLQVVAKYDTFDPNTSKEDNITTNYVLGLNCNFNTWSRIQAFYTWRTEEANSYNNNYFSVQYQIAF